MQTKIKIPALVLAGLLTITPLAACGQDASVGSVGDTVEVEQELVPLAATPAVPTSYTPTAPGTKVAKNEYAAIDYSNAADGYVMIAWLAGGTEKIKVQTKGPSGTTYTYNLNPTGKYEVFPLSDGNGTYAVTVLRNTSGTKYAVMQTQAVPVTLVDEFAPFLRPNQYVNFSTNSTAVSIAGQLAANSKDELSKVEAIYNYVVKNISYDTNLASSVQSGYLPDIDKVIANKKGICFDYAAVTTAMLRSQGVPTKLVVGYTGDVYHAWLNVYSKENGWIDGVISFDGKTWKLMDPTFASTGKQSKEIMTYIGNGSNYQAKYLY